MKEARYFYRDFWVLKPVWLTEVTVEMGWSDGKEGDGSAQMTVKEFGLRVLERSGGIIKEQQQNFKGIWSLKLQGNLRLNSGLIDVPASVNRTQPRVVRACTHILLHARTGGI